MEVERLVRGFAATGRKQIRVSRTPTYGVPPRSPEEGGDGDDVLSGEEEHPTVTGTGNTRQSPQTPTLLPGPPVNNGGLLRLLSWEVKARAGREELDSRNKSFIIDP